MTEKGLKNLLNSYYGTTNIDYSKLLDTKITWEYKSDDPVGEEEWIWVTGFKGTDKNMRCRDCQFEIDKQFDMPENDQIVMCHSGFHFCDKLNNVYDYYAVQDGNRFFEVKALVRRWKKDGYYKVEQRHDKMVAKSIVFTRELTIEEIFNAVDDSEVKNWNIEQKELARQTSVRQAKDSIRVKTLMDLGYSEAFAQFAVRKGSYDIAYTMGNTPNVSMDVKVLTVAMDIYE